MATVSDDFNRANGGLGANWTTITGFTAPSIETNEVVGGTNNAEHGARWSANTFDNDQTSQVTIAADADGGGPLVRCASGAATFYEFYTTGLGQLFYFEVTATSFAQLGADILINTTAGQTLKLSVAGTTLTGNHNGADQTTRTDASITSGSAGFHIFDDACDFDNWIGTGAVVGGTAHVGEARFAGAGSLSANTQKSKTGAVSFAGASTLSVDDFARLMAQATFGGAGSLSVDDVARLQSLATFAGAGSLFASAQKSKDAAATFTGSGSLSANTQKSKTAAATFAGSGSLSAIVNARLASSALFAGAGNLSALSGAPFASDISEQIWSVEGERFEEIADDFIDTGPQFGQLTENSIAATFAGSGNLSVQATLRMQIAARFNGAGNMVADATKAGMASGEATFNGAGNLSVNTAQRMAASAVFAGVGSLSGTVTARLAANAIFAGAGSLSANALQSGLHIGEARFAGAGNLSARTLQRMVAAATFAGAGSLSALGLQAGLHLGEARLTGAGNMSVAVLQRMAARATFAGAGSLQATAEQRGKQQIAATFSGNGSLSVDTTVISTFKFGEATFAGAGNVIPLARARMMIAANMNGAGSMSVLMTGGVIPRVPTGTGSFTSGVVHNRPADPSPTRTTYTPLRSRNTG